jgi:hypothetical protein
MARQRILVDVVAIIIFTQLSRRGKEATNY